VDLALRASSHAACVVGLLAMNIVAATDRPAYCGTEQWRSLVAEASARFAIPQEWLRAVIRAESAACEAIDGHPITSNAGAMGLMQLMPATWKEYRELLALGNDPFNPRDNIFAGAAYLRELYDRYGSPGFVAAYHAGPKRYEAYRLGESSLPAATLEYVREIFPESRLSTAVPTIFARANARSDGGLFIAVTRLDQRRDRAAGESRVAPPDVQSQ
jgi:soluble lytic murein transglycosylase-like protein